MSKTTKRNNFTPEFLRAAADDPEGALSVQFFAAFGVDLSAITAVVKRMIESNDRPVMIMCVTASVQIRANVVFVGREFGNIRSKYPELIIEGERAQQDIFNFSAVHAAGHLICMISGGTLAQKVFKKVGNCITGDGCPDNEAGKINKEIANSWAADDRSSLMRELDMNGINWRNAVDLMFLDMSAKKKAFETRASGRATGAAKVTTAAKVTGTAKPVAGSAKPVEEL